MHSSAIGGREARRRELTASLPLALAIGVLAALLAGFFFPPAEGYARGHDFLDSIFPLYVVRARIPDFFFDFSAVVPQLADGLPFNALGIGDFALGPNLYLLLPPFWAYAVNEAARRLLALVGAYLLLTRYVLPGGPRRSSWIAAATALSFAALPDQANRFATISMLPLLFWAILNLWRGERPLASWAAVILYPFYSFLYLGGFTICGYLLIASLAAWRLRPPTRFAVVGAFAYTVAAYVLIEARMFHQWFVQSDYQSYRHFVEHADASFSAFLAQFVSEFVYGANANHVTRHSPWILAMTAAAALVLILRRRPATGADAILDDREFRRGQALFWLLLALAFVNAAVNALDQGGFFNFKYALGFPFSFHRVDVTSPLVWRLILALSVVLLAAALGPRLRPFVYGAFALVVAHSLLQFPGVKEELKRAVGAPQHVGLKSFLTGRRPPPPSFVNAKSSYNPGYTRLGEYYMEDAFSAIRPALAAELGYPSGYRTASLGIPPSVSLFHGFRPLDGLFYDVSADYAKAFVRLTAPEYAKDGREPNDRTGGLILHISPRSFAGEGVEFAFDACLFAEMGGRVLFSAWPILNAPQLQLKPLGDFGGVRVYRVSPALRC